MAYQVDLLKAHIHHTGSTHRTFINMYRNYYKLKKERKLKKREKGYVT